MQVKETVVHKTDRFSFLIFFMIILFIFPVVTEVTASSARAARGIHVDWTPKEIIEAVVPSQTVEKKLKFSFTLSNRFSVKYDVTLKASPDLQPFISVNPKRIEKVLPNQVYSTQLTISIPSDTAPGEYEGAIRLFVRMHWVGLFWPKWKGRPASPNLRILIKVTSQTVDLSIKNGNTYPTRITQGPDGKFYVTDALAGSVFIYNENLILVGELKGFDSPLGVAVDPNGNIYVGNNGRDNVEVYRADGVFKSTIDDGNILMPNDMALDRDGNLYVADSLANVVKVYDSSGQPLRNIEGSGDNGGLNFPVAITIHYNDQNLGELYVADQGNSKVQVFNLEGVFLRSFGEKAYLSGMTGKTLNWIGMFTKLQSLAFDHQGRLHAADCLMNIVQIFNAETGEYEDSYGTFGVDIGQLNLPLDIFIANSEQPDIDQVIVTNTGNGRVEIIHTIPIP